MYFAWLRISGARGLICPLRATTERCAHITAALEDFDFRRATAAIWAIVEEANRSIEATRPWELAKAERHGDPEASAHLNAALAALHHACASLATHLAPFVPDAAQRIATQCTPSDGRLRPSTALFPRIEP